LIKAKSTDITEAAIKDGTKTIASGAFNGCSNLTSITIPSGVTSIGDNAFEDCSSLTIYAKAAKKPDGWNSDWNVSNCPVVWGYKG
ncbi:MAG: leucine-rich repeat protein, partial [Christensenellales bacterium]